MMMKMIMIPFTVMTNMAMMNRVRKNTRMMEVTKKNKT